MDSSAIIAVVGTLIGTLGGILLGYLMQNKVAERQRRWALEDERRRLRTELLESRLKTIEEAMGLMISRIDHAVYLEIAIPVSVDDDTMRQREQQTNEKISSAWTTINVIGSEQLKENMGILLKIYWESLETTLDPDEGEKAQGAQLEIIKIIDKIRLEV